MSNDIEPADAAKIEAAAVQMAGEAETSKPAESETPATPETPAEGETAPAETKESAAGKNPPPADKAARRRRIVKKILKWTGIVFGALLLLLILALVFRDPILKAILPKYLSSMIGVKVEVADIDTSLFKGTLRVKGFKVANPEGYSNDKKAAALEELFVKIDIGSLFTNKIIIDEIRLTGLAVNVESHKFLDLLMEKECNLKAIADGYQRRNPPKEKKEPSDEKKSKTKVVIKLLKIEKLSLSLAVEDVSLNATLLENYSREDRDIGEEEEEEKNWKDDLKERVSKFWDSYFWKYVKERAKDAKSTWEMVKPKIPGISSAVIGVEVMVADVDLSPDGALRITGVTVANPDGYSQDQNAVELKELYVKVDRDSLLTDKIVIEELRLNGFAVNVEANDGIRMQEEMECNLKAICDNVKRNFDPEKKKQSSHASVSSGAKGSAEKKNKPQLVIRLLKVENSAISLKVKDMGIDQKLDISLEERDLGGENNSFEELGKRILEDYKTKLTTVGGGGKEKEKRSPRNIGFKFKRRKKKQ